MKKLIVACCLLTLILCGCSPREKMDGNVYKLVSDSASVGTENESIRGLRIDLDRGDTLLVKYAMGPGIFMDADFIYDSEAKCYKSTSPLVFGRGAERKSLMLLSLAGSGEILLQFVDMAGNVQKRYRKIYKMKVDLKTHRDAYYAEDGFKL